MVAAFIWLQVITHTRSGGAVIAFVEPEATGKSNLLTIVPKLLVPALRSLIPTSRSTRLEAQYLFEGPSDKPRTSCPLLLAIRSALLACDRRSLLSRTYRRAANGTIVLCDRYPSSQSGAQDGPQLSQLSASTNGHSIRRRLAHIEARLCRQIPPPDLVIYLNAPSEVALLRNATRGKKEPEAYVRRRHARSSNLEFDKVPVRKINTNQPLDETVLEVKKAIWNAF